MDKRFARTPDAAVICNGRVWLNESHARWGVFLDKLELHYQYRPKDESNADFIVDVQGRQTLYLAITGPYIENEWGNWPEWFARREYDLGENEEYRPLGKQYVSLVGMPIQKSSDIEYLLSGRNQALSDDTYQKENEFDCLP